MLDAILRTLGLQDAEGNTPLPVLVSHLKEKRLLLILDNFEQVTRAGPDVAELLEYCPNITAIVTSREPLHVRGEQQFPVPPLPFPETDNAYSPPGQDLSRYPSVSLFLERARAVRSDFALDEASSPAVAALCAMMEGVPLAIELIAARVKVLPPCGPAGADLLQPLRPVANAHGGASDLPARHRTLRDAIEWSYNLLDEADRKVFARLSVFAGGCTLAAAEAVCDSMGDLRDGAFDHIVSLLDKSLIQKEDGECEVRFSMLEAVREDAWEHLSAGGDLAMVQRSHAEYFIALAETANFRLVGAEQKHWFDRLECEHDNLRAALNWTIEAGEASLASRLAVALVRFWDIHAHFTEGRRWLERVMSHFSSSMPSDATATLLKAAGALAESQGDLPEAVRLLTRSLALQREVGDQLGVASSLNNLAVVYMDEGEFSLAGDLYQESLNLYQESADLEGIASTLSNLGLLYLYTEEYDLAVQALEESLSLRRQLGDVRGGAVALCNLGEAARRRGDSKEAHRLFAEALRCVGDIGVKGLLLACVGGLATVAVSEKKPLHAARLFGAEAALREALDAPLPASDREEYDLYVRSARDMTDSDAFDEAWLLGSRMNLQQVVEYALEGTQQ